MLPWIVLTIAAGSEWAPDSASGRDLLIVVGEGDFRFENTTRGELLVRTGIMQPHLLQEIDTHLAVAGFPQVPSHPIPPGASLVTMSRETDDALHGVRFDYFAGLKMPGYRELLRSFDAWSRCLREGGMPPGFVVLAS